MTIRIFTAPEDGDNGPLKYIVEEFARIQNARASFEVVSSGGAEIYYTVTPPGNGCFWIPRAERFTTDGYRMFSPSGLAPSEPLFEGRDVPVFEDSFYGSAEAAADCPFDIFYNAFVHLSRIEERTCEVAGRPLQSYLARHPRRERWVYDIPVVNYLFLLLQRMIEARAGTDAFGPARAAGIEFSHDLDYVEKTLPLRIKQTAFCAYNAGRRAAAGDLKGAGDYIARGAKFGFCGADYWQFERWMEWEREAGARSIFYVYAGAPGAGAGARAKGWLLDPSYDVAANARLRDVLRKLLDGGWGVGLHGSFESAGDAGMLKMEKERLERAIGRGVEAVRQHWLRFTEKTPAAQIAAGLKRDSTLGFNETCGFRSGIASGYRPYNFEAGAAHDIMETPLALMDSNIFDYAAGAEGAAARADEILREAMKFPGAVSVDWHQRTCHTDYGWEGPYLDILKKYGAHASGV